MSARRKNHLSFLLAIFSFLLIIAVMLIAAWYTNTKLENDSIFYVVVFASLFLLIFITQYYKSLIDSITNESYLIRIKDNAEKPISMVRTKDLKAFKNYLINEEFIMHSDDEEHFLFYRVRKDHIKQILKGYILEIIVYVSPSSDEYYLASVDDEIDKIQKISEKASQRLDVMLITQIKAVGDLSKNEKSKIAEIVFLKTSLAGVISTINVGLHHNSGLAVMLYSTKYSPSLYYKYHVEQIKKYI